MSISEIISKQRDFFNSRKTFDVNYRKTALEKLKYSICKNADELYLAFGRDYNKCQFDVISTELMLVMQELNSMIKKIKHYSKIRRVRTSLTNFPSKGLIVPEPFGVTLVVSPWNYPFQLAMVPLIGAIAAGNTVILKPSASSLNVAMCLKKILSVFGEEYVYVVTGDRNANEDLFDQRFDFVFFTGGTSTAKILMSKLSKYLTPAVLELGGKSPCIIDEDAKLDVAARRAVWGKFLNAGQTCVAPDYFLVHKSVHQEFVQKVVENIKQHYYPEGKLCENFVNIINEKQKAQILSFIEESKVVFGGKCVDRCLEPTVMDNVTFDDKIMQQEIFGPILPIIEFSSLKQELERLKTKEKPLALYYFGEDKAKQDKVMRLALFGGGCINDTLMHVTEENLPFGGVGFSGMGNYHGKKTFDAFTHYKSVLKKSSKLELKLKYMPYSCKKTNMIKWLSGLK